MINLNYLFNNNKTLWLQPFIKYVFLESGTQHLCSVAGPGGAILYYFLCANQFIPQQCIILLKLMTCSVCSNINLQNKRQREIIRHNACHFNHEIRVQFQCDGETEDKQGIIYLQPKYKYSHQNKYLLATQVYISIKSKYTRPIQFIP